MWFPQINYIIIIIIRTHILHNYKVPKNNFIDRNLFVVVTHVEKLGRIYIFFFSMYQPIVETWANLSHYVHMPLELRENKCQWQLHFMGAIMMERCTFATVFCSLRIVFWKFKKIVWNWAHLRCKNIKIIGFFLILSIVIWGLFWGFFYTLLRPLYANRLRKTGRNSNCALWISVPIANAPKCQSAILGPKKLHA